MHTHRERAPTGMHGVVKGCKRELGCKTPLTLLCMLCTGVLSSYGELEHMASGRAELAPFNPTQKQPKMSYKVMGTQRLSGTAARTLPALPPVQHAPSCSG